MPRFRAVFDNAVERQSFTPEFAEAARSLFDGSAPADPLRRGA